MVRTSPNQSLPRVVTSGNTQVAGSARLSVGMSWLGRPEGHSGRPHGCVAAAAHTAIILVRHTVGRALADPVAAPRVLHGARLHGVDLQERAAHLDVRRPLLVPPAPWDYLGVHAVCP